MDAAERCGDCDQMLYQTLGYHDGWPMARSAHDDVRCDEVKWRKEQREWMALVLQALQSKT